VAAKIHNEKQCPLPHLLKFTALLFIVFILCNIGTDSDEIAANDKVTQSFIAYQPDGLYDSYGGRIIIQYSPDGAGTFRIGNTYSDQISLAHNDTGKGVFRVSWMSTSPIRPGDALFSIIYETNSSSGAIKEIDADSFSNTGKKLLDPATGEPGVTLVPSESVDGPNDDGLSNKPVDALRDDSLANNPVVGTNDDGFGNGNDNTGEEKEESDGTNFRRKLVLSEEIEELQEEKPKGNDDFGHGSPYQLAESSPYNPTTPLNSWKKFPDDISVAENIADPPDTTESHRKGTAYVRFSEQEKDQNMPIPPFVKVRMDRDIASLHEVILRSGDEDKILVISIDGRISDKSQNTIFHQCPGMLQNIVSRLTMAQNDSAIKAVILKINSMGGSATVTDILYNEILKFKKKTKVKIIAFIMDAAVSGGYYLSLTADRIIAHPTSIVGCFKAVFADSFNPNLNDAQNGMKDMSKALTNRFVNLVANRRNIKLTKLSAMSVSNILPATKALKTKLIDRIGYFEVVLAEAKKILNFPKTPSIIAYRRNIYPDDNLYNTSDDDTCGTSGDTVPAGFYYLWLPNLQVK
jgi:protease IV